MVLVMCRTPFSLTDFSVGTKCLITSGIEKLKVPVGSKICIFSSEVFTLTLEVSCVSPRTVSRAVKEVPLWLRSKLKTLAIAAIVAYKIKIRI